MLWFLVACDTPDSAEETAAELDPRVVLGESRACESPDDSPTYTESGASWGLLDGESEADRHEESPSLAIADIDGNGFDDVLVLQQLGQSYFYANDGTQFLATKLTGSGPGTSALFIDLNGDGALELLVGGLVPYVSWDLDKAPTFLTGVPAIDDHAPLPLHDFAPGDVDGDGGVDFYAPIARDQQGGVDYNDVLVSFPGGEAAVDAVAVPWDVGVRHGFDATWFDADGDGDQDVYVANDFGSIMGASTLLRNDSGLLVDAADACLCSLLSNSKGVEVGDVNRDGLPDLYVAGNPQNTLLTQLGDGTFVDVTAATGAGAVESPVTGWGANLVDYDNDGWLDLLSAQGDRWNTGNENERVDVSPRLLRQVDGTFADVGEDVGVTGSGSFRAAASLDFNLDGVEDFLVTSLEEAPLFFLSDGCTAASWVEVTAPRGSRVQVDTAGGTQTAWVRGDEGYLSNGPPRVHFGLGEAEGVSAMRVLLPTGETIATGPFEGRRRVDVVTE